MQGNNYEFSNEVNMEIKPTDELNLHTLAVESVHFNPQNEAEMMTASHDHFICFYDLNKMQMTRKVNGGAYSWSYFRKGIWCAKYSPDGKTVVAGTSDSKLIHLASDSDKPTVYDLSNDIDTVAALDFSPDGKRLALSGQNQKAIFLGVEKLDKKLSEIQGICR